ncbi:MAG: hypothetical protein JNJ95_10025 [Dechloromonas sp.]|nr:hypothetical protein [Dechloromonas sp.]
MDKQLPHLNGFEAAQINRADSLNKTTPILTMTPNPFDGNHDACLASGLNNHTGKPVSPQTSTGWLDTPASQRRGIQP